MRGDFSTVRDVVRWLSGAPEGTMLPAATVASVLDDVLDGAGESERASEGLHPVESREVTWRQKLWTAPSQTRIGVQELREALVVSESWIYSRTKESADPRLPHRKMGGALVFTAGEIRGWIEEHEEIEVAGPMASTEESRRLEVVG